jgi:integrase
MPITRHHTGQWLYQFDRVIAGNRTRANRVLPPGWSKKQAEEFDRIETARLFALATGVTKLQPLIEDAVLLYLQQHAPTLKNQIDLTGALELCLPWYAGKSMDKLADVAKQFISDNHELLSPGTIRNRMAYLRAACRWAWKKHGMGQHDPAERMILPKPGKPRQLYFDRAVMLRIARAMHYQPSRAVFRVAFYSGMRLSEVLRSQPVQTVSGLGLGIIDSKNGTPHIVPANDRVAHLIRNTAWPPVVHKSTVSHHTKLAMKSLDLGHYRFHDSRHSTASEMIQQGVSLNTVGAVLNHKSTASTKIYAHLATQQLADAVRLVGRKSVKIPQPGPQAKAA